MEPMMTTQTIDGMARQTHENVLLALRNLDRVLGDLSPAGKPDGDSIAPSPPRSTYEVMSDTVGLVSELNRLTCVLGDRIGGSQPTAAYDSHPDRGCDVTVSTKAYSGRPMNRPY